MVPAASLVTQVIARSCRLLKRPWSVLVLLAVLTVACADDENRYGTPDPEVPSSTTATTQPPTTVATTTLPMPDLLVADGVLGEAARACADWLGDPIVGSPEWDEADLNNQRCASAGSEAWTTSPAVAAARAANVEVRDAPFGGDPFRAPHRWAPDRGTYEMLTWTDREGTTWPAALFGPPDLDVGPPRPGVLLLCHACAPLPQTTESIPGWYWAAEAMAEHGYLVLYATIGGNSATRAVDAADFFTSTSERPTSAGEFNPWFEHLDRDRLGLAGHSGAAGVALEIGHTDRRFSAIVAWDPANSATFPDLIPATPTMIQLADYTLRQGIVARAEPPTAQAGSKYTYFETIRAAGIDTMQVAVRATTHIDWTRMAAGVGQIEGFDLRHSIFGEAVATYYTLAWLDRYLTGDDRATARLTASGAQRLDPFADVYAIGAGLYDPDAADPTDPESGNVPIMVGGLPVANLLSFNYPSGYHLDGGRATCDDMRSGCEATR